MSKKKSKIKKDPQFVTPAGEPVDKLPHGVSFRPVPTHIDERGSLFEIFDERWDWSDEPLVYSYCSTMRPGIVKGWALHEIHEDRYFVMFGELLVVMYDTRENSPTKGLLSKIVLSEYNRGLLNVPMGIWHADQNIGDKDVVLVNFPTHPYYHEDPDKFRLPLENDLIPYTFEGHKGGW